VLAGYDQWHLQSFAVATRHDFGQGAAFYLGAVVKEPEFYSRFLHLALTRAGLAAMVIPPHGVEVTLRERDSHALLFLLNHTEETQTVKVPAGQPELLSGDTTGTSLELAPYGVAVVKLARDGG
jgi:beta-galactosidase